MLVKIVFDKGRFRLKKKVTFEDYQKMINILFPKIIPISFKNLKLGNIKIDYEIDENRVDEKELLFRQVVAELLFLSEFLEKDINLAIDLQNRTKEKLKRFGLLLELFFPHSANMLNFGFYYVLKDEDIFELIKTEGPTALRNSFIQMLLREWLSDKNIAKRKINKLINSLMEFSFKNSNKDTSFPLGRSSIESLELLGPDWIKELHRNISQILKLVKQIRLIKKREKKYIEKEISKSIKQAFELYVLLLKKVCDENKDSKELQEKLAGLKKGLTLCEKMKLPNPISECIENNEDLKTEFIEFKCRPSILAIKVIAILLEASNQTIKNIIYPRKK